MNDRELLELAAKAAGTVLGAWHDSAGAFLYRDAYPGQMWWNPLTDDGDAFRLAVKLNIPVLPYDDETSTGTTGVVAKNWGGKEANTRRAIVRAAAEVGKGMLTHEEFVLMFQGRFEPEEVERAKAEIGRKM